MIFMLAKKYDPREMEGKWQKWWLEKGIYRFDPRSKKPVFSIDVPPVYASAAHLHVGHALHYTQFEFMARFWRMNGKEVYFPPCFDNNGLPTEKYVEEKYKITKGDMPRDEFRKLCRKEAGKVEEEYANRAFKGLGHSHDWNLLYTTIDPDAQIVSQLAFLQLVEHGDAYRAEEPVLWCPYHQTALAQAEVENKPRTTVLNYLYFELEGGGKIEIATTRPEFLPACVGIFVHPEDKRYKKLVGKKAIVPIFGQKVPIMEDEKVEKDFGSGIVMICTFGDTTDIEWWKGHKLPLKICITEDGKLNELGGKYRGLDLNKAKEVIKEDLAKEGYVIKEENLQQEVGMCWRCKTPVEYIVAKQWFIKTLDYKKEIIAQSKKINWHPSFYRKRLEDWTNNLGWDWCISRQRHYGVPIPVWYCRKCGKPLLAEEKDLPVDPLFTKPDKKCGCGSGDFDPEEDVFDTWMTSSMTPQIASQQFKNPEIYKKIFPMSLRPQSHDIIRTWAFYTILKSFLLYKEIPWKDVMIGTYVLDTKGRGMHKSSGNVIWLPDMLKKYSVDALRYWSASAGVGEDLPFQEKEMVHGTKLLLKLWNSARFASLHIKDAREAKKMELEDRWILSRLSETVKNYRELMESYRISKARKELEMFFLHDFCDFYLEMAKHRLYGEDKKSKAAAQFTLYKTFLGITKLWAPIIPHITEEIYQELFREKEKDESVHLSQLPEAEKLDKEALELGKMATEVISQVRQYKTQKDMAMNAELERIVIESNSDKIKEAEEVIKGTMKIKNVEYKKGKELKVEVKA